MTADFNNYHSERLAEDIHESQGAIEEHNVEGDQSINSDKRKKRPVQTEQKPTKGLGRFSFWKSTPEGGAEKLAKKITKRGGENERSPPINIKTLYKPNLISKLLCTLSVLL
jgi:hypothetical protein